MAELDAVQSSNVKHISGAFADVKVGIPPLSTQLEFEKNQGQRLGIFLVDGEGGLSGKVVVHSPGQLDDGRLRPGDIIETVGDVPVTDAMHASELIVSAGPVLKLSVLHADKSPSEVSALLDQHQKNSNGQSLPPSKLLKRSGWPSWSSLSGSSYNTLHEDGDSD